MKASLKNAKSLFSKNQIEIIGRFLHHLQKQMPLKEKIHLKFVPERTGHMTTGVRLPHGEITVLASNRLLIDVLRTIGHEWVHEYQHQIMGLSDMAHIKDIGGPEENMCNILAGIFIKMFEKSHPEDTPYLYGEKI